MHLQMSRTLQGDACSTPWGICRSQSHLPQPVPASRPHRAPHNLRASPRCFPGKQHRNMGPPRTKGSRSQKPALVMTRWTNARLDHSSESSLRVKGRPGPLAANKQQAACTLHPGRQRPKTKALELALCVVMEGEHPVQCDNTTYTICLAVSGHAGVPDPGRQTAATIRPSPRGTPPNPRFPLTPQLPSPHPKPPGRFPIMGKRRTPHLRSQIDFTPQTKILVQTDRLNGAGG